MTTRILQLIGAAVGEGASDGGCKWGAAALREQGLAQALAAAGRIATWGDTITAQAAVARDRLDVIDRFSEQLAASVEKTLRYGKQPLVVGGDHSCAAGTWSAAAQVLRPTGRLGLVWIDAHLDAHTPQTSDSQAPHGMPLAALLGHGDDGMAALYGWRGKLLPQHVVVIGARSYEPAEAELLADLKVRVMGMEEVLDRSFAACFEEARALVKQDTAAWGLTLDLDGLDPLDAPGTGTPVDNGIRLDDALQALGGCALDPDFIGLELAEYNPLRDFGGRTARAAIQLACAVLTPARLDWAMAA